MIAFTCMFPSACSRSPAPYRALYGVPCGGRTARWRVVCMRAMQVGMMVMALESAGGSARATVVGADTASATGTPHAPRAGAAPARVTGRPQAVGGGPAARQDFSFATCQSHLSDDPDGTRDYAEDWQEHGGGAEAEYCGALAEMALGDVGDAADTLDRLSHITHWPHGEAAPPAKAPSSAPSQAAGTPGGGREEERHDTPESLHRRAHVAEEAARAWQADDSPRQALDSATYGLSLDPHDMTLRVIHARISVDMGMAQQAVSDLTPLPDDATLRVDALVTRAAANRELGQIDLAATDIAAALQQAPHNVAAELESGILHERQGKMEDARADWQQVIALAPDSHEADLARQDLSLLEADPAAP
ncbi:tetratricopeptide repeat protein [Novacetimonas maltaceti]|uniref:Uncharacterized protein n=1 Tax=Novacetimonas maltaceti TaxID=1203393 RepID=A0A2S3W543_9PROT|nr:tetratricopeptide repeat protein [Novacetimonas maltaceti]POF63673.1 hypothetical protein KMAL_06390 [Novacetimonas maltaceti]